MSEFGSSGDLGYNGFPVSLNYFSAIPEVTTINDPNLVIIFKSLLKKDSTTKEKSLTDLSTLINDPRNSDLFKDDIVIISWVQLYPKLALDNSRNVRTLSHKIQADFLAVVGGKSFSKYLKSSMPIWLLGLFDSDKTMASTTYKYLLESFQNDREKVEKIWVIFQKQIITYVNTIVNSETRESLSDQRYTKEDDSYAKYERALNGGIMMITKIILVINSSTDIDEELVSQVEALLSSESLWAYFSRSVDTFNIPLFKSYLILIKSVFQLADDNTPNQFTQRLSEVKSVYKFISKTFIKNVKLKPTNKSSSGAIIYSNVIIQFWDSIIALTNFSTLAEPFKKSMKIKKNFWELGGSKSFSRLLDYLKLGNCQLSPIYYNVLVSFFHSLATAGIKSSDDFAFLDFTSSKDAKLVLVKVLVSQLKAASSFDYKTRIIACILETYKLFKIADSENLHDTIVFSIEEALSKKPIKPSDKTLKSESIAQVGDFLENNELYFSKFNALVVESIAENSPTLKTDDVQIDTAVLMDTHFEILKALSTSGSQTASKLVVGVVEVLTEDSTITELATPFTILQLFFTKKFPFDDSTSSILQEFIGQLPSFIEPGFVDLPIDLAMSIIDSKILVSDDFINDCYTKILLVSPSTTSVFLRHLHGRKVLNLRDFRFPEITTYLNSLSTKSDLTHSEALLIYKFSDDATIFRNLIIASSSTRQRSNEFIKHFVRDTETFSMVEDETETQLCLRQIFAHAWSDVLSPHHKKFIEMGQGPATLHLVRDALYEYIVTTTTVTDNLKEVSLLVSDTFQLFPLDKFHDQVVFAANNIDINLLSIANPLEHNIHLVPVNEQASGALDSAIVSLGRFLYAFWGNGESIEFGEDKLSMTVLSGLVAEYIADYCFLSSTQLEESDLISLALSKTFQQLRIDPKTLLELLIDPSEVDFPNNVASFLSGKFTTADYTYIHIYYARLLKNLCQHTFSSISFTDFESLNLDFNKFVAQPLKLAVLLMTFHDFVPKLAKFERVRNFVAAEVLGVKGESSILTDGLKWITLSLNFFNIDVDEDISYEPIPPRRLVMVLSQISKWLESDIAYDESFIVMRTQISRLFSAIVSLGTFKIPDNLLDIAFNLLLDNLNTSQVEKAHVELRYFTFKLFISLNKYVDADYPEWTEVKKSFGEDTIELITNEEIGAYDSKLNNQPVALFQDLSFRVLRSLDLKVRTISEIKDKLYKVLAESKSIPLQRLAASYLKAYILESQQDFAIEFQLNKSSISEDDEDGNSLKAELPKTLLETIDNFNEDFDDCENSKISSFLWSWLLIFAHFEDIPYSIRNKYILTFNNSGAIEKLLDTIFNEVDVSDVKVLKKFAYAEDGKSDGKIKLSDNLIQHYDIIEGYPGEDFSVEVKFLLVHLYFLIFQHLGSIAQTWFKEIRDKLFKQQIEKFSVLYISPLIVSKILDEVSKSKAKLTNSEENMVIKVNSVSNEIKSIYTIDEQTMEMVIKIPTNYPLDNVTVEGPLRLGVKENQWKAWLLASQRIISLTNGSIMEAVELFNRNVNLHFSGFEDCAICYSILHQDHSLPSKTCPTCLNKFHSACLYKWFKSSGASTCPLCRSAFNFRTSRTT